MIFARICTQASIAEELATEAGREEVRRRCRNANVLEKSYWVDPFAVNQHTIICDTQLASEGTTPGAAAFAPCTCGHPKYTNGPLCEVNKFDDMMVQLVARSRGFAQVIVLDEEFRLFKRAWCIAEIAVAAQGHIHQRLKAFSEDSLYRNYPEMKAFDVDTCEASHPPDKKMILDRINQHYKHLNDFNEVMFNIVHSMVDLKLKTLKIEV